MNQRTSTSVGGYSADTQILTCRGWKSFPDLSDDDEVATRSETGRFEWQVPTSRDSRQFDGQMVEFKSKSVDLLVTPDHPMVVRKPAAYGIKHPYAEGLDWHHRAAERLAATPESQWHLPANSRWSPTSWDAEFYLPGWEADRRHPAHEEATKWLADFLGDREWTRSTEVVAARKAAGISEQAYMAARKYLGVKKRKVGCHLWGESWWEVSAPTREYLPSDGAYTPMRDLRLPMEVFCPLLGLFLAEGWVRKDRNDVIVSQFPTSRHLPDIWDILNATGLVWNYGERHGKFITSHKTLAPWLRENAGQYAWGKRVPDGYKDLPPHLLNEMLRGMMMGDGHETEGGQRCYTTTSPRLADDVQEIFQKTGLNGVINTYDMSKYPTTLFDGERTRPVHVVRERKRDTNFLPHASRPEYRGTVHHVTVPNGVVYVRRNGKPHWCG